MKSTMTTLTFRRFNRCFGTVTGTFNNNVGSILLSNPSKLNAMDLSMYKKIPSVVQQLTNQSDIRVCILSGEGNKAFGAGSDISEFPLVRTGVTQANLYSKYEDEASDALCSLSYPLIAKIHGNCYGGGLNLALTADLRYCSDDATFCIPPAKLGIGYPSKLMKLLVNAIGKSNAKHLLLTSEIIDAKDAKRIGLVNGILPKQELDQYVDQIAINITRLAPLTLLQCKLELSIDEQDENVAKKTKKALDAYNNCNTSDDYKTGVQSFLNKRKPNFEGK